MNAFFHLQGQRISQARKGEVAGSCKMLVCSYKTAKHQIPNSFQFIMHTVWPIILKRENRKRIRKG
jgi:hypothetical protein